MNVNEAVMEKVMEVLKNQEVVDQMNKVSSQDEIYEIAKGSLENVSKEEFFQAVKELKEADGCIRLSDAELDGVAGGIRDDAAAVTLGHINISPVEQM